MDESSRATTVKLNPRLLDDLVSILAVVLCLGSFAWALDLYRDVGLQIYTEQYLGGMLAIAIPLVYLAVPAGRGRFRQGPVPWYDFCAAAAGTLAAGYTAWRYPELAEAVDRRPWDGLVAGGAMVALLIEGLRRTAGRVLAFVVVGFLVLALIGEYLPGDLQGRPVDAARLVYYLGWDSTSVLGTPLRIVTTIVVAFVFFGRILFISGGSAFFTDFAMVLMGRYRGGQAKISIFASCIFGSISGSTVSNVVTTGVVTIPLMQRGGYSARHAGAIEAVASTGGQLMPPVDGRRGLSDGRVPASVLRGGGSGRRGSGGALLRRAFPPGRPRSGQGQSEERRQVGNPRRERGDQERLVLPAAVHRAGRGAFLAQLPPPRHRRCWEPPSSSPPPRPSDTRASDCPRRIFPGRSGAPGSG